MNANTGSVYLRGRYYDPATERVIAEDPMKDGGNWYAYCGDDPVNYIDPSGYRLDKQIVFPLIIEGIPTTDVIPIRGPIPVFP